MNYHLINFFMIFVFDDLMPGGCVFCILSNN